IDHTVGFTGLAGLGSTVGGDAPLAMVHARNEAHAARAEAALRSAYRVGDEAAAPSAAVLERIGPL
ncbi:MAG: thymidine phosphorylase, partial [Bauldia litoralis]